MTEQSTPVKKSSHVKLIILAIITVIALAGVVYYFRQPNIQVINFRFLDTTCFYGRNLYWDFSLINTRGDGFAHVQYLFDSSVNHESDYYVRSGQTLNFTDTIHVTDCNPHTGSVQITSQWTS